MAWPGSRGTPTIPWSCCAGCGSTALPPIVDSLSLAHMRHLKFSRPDVYARTAWLLEPMDYVTMRLTGRATANQASAFMYLMTDNRRLDITDYEPHLVAASLIDREKLPELVPMDAIVGTLLPDVAEELGLSPSTKVVTGLNDTQAGGIGAGAFAGTHAAVSIGLDERDDHARGLQAHGRPFHSIVSMPSPVPDTYFVMAENGMAGAALERFLTNIVYGSDHFSEAAVHDRYDALQRVAGGIPAGSDGLMFLPWLSGAIAPSEDGQMRGGFLNISTRTTRGDMARAVLEGVSQNLRWLRGPVEKFAKRRFTHFSIYGGAARSDLWCQIMADVLGSPVHQLDNCDYTVSVGAGLLAFERLGDLGFDDIGSLVRTRRVFDPDPRNTATYDVLHEQFVKAFKATRPIHRALNAQQGAEPDGPRRHRCDPRRGDRRCPRRRVDRAGLLPHGHDRRQQARRHRLRPGDRGRQAGRGPRPRRHQRTLPGPPGDRRGERHHGLRSDQLDHRPDRRDARVHQRDAHVGHAARTGRRRSAGGRRDAPALHRRDVRRRPRPGVEVPARRSRAPTADPRVATLADAIMYSTHPSMLEWAGVLDQFRDLSAQVRLQSWGGDCYAFALVAMGTIDLVIDGCLMPYDIVPLIPIIELAGGVVTDIEGRVPMDGGTVIAAANPDLHAQALAALRG